MITSEGANLKTPCIPLYSQSQPRPQPLPHLHQRPQPSPHQSPSAARGTSKKLPHSLREIP